MIDFILDAHIARRLSFDFGCLCVLHQVSDTLKKFAVKVTTASVSERKEILGELKQCISGKGEEIDAHLVSIFVYFLLSLCLFFVLDCQIKAMCMSL